MCIPVGRIRIPETGLINAQGIVGRTSSHAGRSREFGWSVLTESRAGGHESLYSLLLDCDTDPINSW